MVRKWLGAFFLGLCAMVTATAIPVPHRPRAAAQPVEVVSLHEAMCPDCVAQDWNFYGVKKDLGNILNMTTLWWGNAKLLPGEKIICQHGPVECEANAFLSCVSHHHPVQHDEFVHCLDWSLIFGCPGGCPAPPPVPMYHKFSQNCSTVLGMNYSALQTCATGEEGLALALAAQKKTAPYKHTYVPWLVINGVHNPVAEQSPKNFVLEVCKAYKDPAALPPVCTGAPADVAVPHSGRVRPGREEDRFFVEMP